MLAKDHLQAQTPHYKVKARKRENKFLHTENAYPFTAIYNKLATRSLKFRKLVSSIDRTKQLQSTKLFPVATTNELALCWGLKRNKKEKKKKAKPCLIPLSENDANDD